MTKPLITDYFGCNVFSETVMEQYLSADTFSALKRTITNGEKLTIEIADEVAEAMMRWAVSQGATHFTHWFQPMTGTTAEKHDSFIEPDGRGHIRLEFSGKALIKGEPDASSFPSGGLRETFEARGYTTWDCTSPAFIREDKDGVSTLCIPTAFCSFTGEALDEKTPLLRSMDTLNAHGRRVLAHLGIETQKVFATVSGEQEYFLIDKELYKRRKDIIYTGSTLFGAPPAKGQQLDDHYYSFLPERVSRFMAQVNDELWKMGVLAKTQHNETAPAQFELAPVFTGANIAVDNNQIIMEMLRKVADRNGFTCLLHEKPFRGVSGSGKHNNWSLATDSGLNLLKFSSDPKYYNVFKTFFVAVIAAVEEHASALRLSCATLANEYRLGGNEAPPPIISVYIGQKLLEMLERIERKDVVAGKTIETMNIGVSTLAVLHRDDADRNRTSPLSFTGNKFEFRMVGSSQSLGLPNTVMNTIVAEQLCKIADRLDVAHDTQAELENILSELATRCKRVVFNGNNYSQDWHDEAKRRHLPIIANTVDALECYADPQLMELFERHGVFSKNEMLSRREIGLNTYIKQSNIEAATMLKISRQRLLPACIHYSQSLSDSVNSLLGAGIKDSTHKKLLFAICSLIDEFGSTIETLDAAVAKALSFQDPLKQARCFSWEVKLAMADLRSCVDKLEVVVDKAYWPLPSYGEMLFNIS